MKTELVTKIQSRYRAFKEFKEGGNTRHSDGTKYIYPSELYISQVALSIFKTLQPRREE